MYHKHFKLSFIFIFLLFFFFGLNQAQAYHLNVFYNTNLPEVSDEDVIKAKQQTKELSQKLQFQEQALAEMYQKFKENDYKVKANTILFKLANGSKLSIPFTENQIEKVSSVGEVEMKIKNIEIKNRLYTELLDAALEDIQFHILEIKEIIRHADEHLNNALAAYKVGKQAKADQLFDQGKKDYIHALKTWTGFDTQIKEIYKLIGKIQSNKFDKQKFVSELAEMP